MAESGPKGSPDAREPVLLSLTLGWVPERGWPRDVWVAAMLMPVYTEQSRRLHINLNSMSKFANTKQAVESP